MTLTRNLLILLAILSLTSTSHVRNKAMHDLSWLFSMENSDQVENNSDDSGNEISDSEEPKTCQTPECRVIAQAFSETMNKSVDPCDNFYEFACGGWKAKQAVPPYLSAWSRFAQFQSTVENRVKELLEEPQSDQDILPVRQAKKWYASCMDIETREARGIKPIESLVMQNGGWPMIMDSSEWSEEDFTWQEIEEHYAHLTGEYTFYKFTPIRVGDGDDETVRAVIFTEPSLPLEDNIPLKYRNYTGDDYVIYRLMIQGVAELFIDHTRADVSEEQLEKDIDDIIQFEKILYMASKKEDAFALEENSLDDLEETDIDTFIDWYNNRTKSIHDPNGQIDWMTVLQSLFDMANAKIDPFSGVAITNTAYYYLLPKILAQTDKRTIINYIHWKFVSQTLPYTIDEVKDILFELVKEEYGVHSRPPRWRECVKEMLMKDAIAYMFVKRFVKDSTVNHVLDMMKDIQKELKVQIDSSNWMSPEGKAAAKKKVDEMKTSIGFPDWYKNRTAVIHHYKGLTIGYEYLDNYLSFKRYETRAKVRQFAGYDGNAQWMMDPLEVNAAYGMGVNIMVVPAVDFQPPLFGNKVPEYVNYGTAGVVIGHEMGHGLDYSGIEERINKSDGTTEGLTPQIYYQRAKCFIDQFDTYYEGQTVAPDPAENYNDASSETKGRRTVGENVADTTGLQSVFKAWKKMVADKKPNGELKLPGFEHFTDEQMFFLSFAGVWCEVATPEHAQRKAILRDVHSPGRYRVIGAVSNTLDFSRVFNCPAGSGMNPENKCSVWQKPGATPKLKKSRRHHWFEHRNW